MHDGLVVLQYVEVDELEEEKKKTIMDRMLLVAAKRFMVVMLDAMMLRLTPTQAPSTTFPDPSEPIRMVLYFTN